MINIQNSFLWQIFFPIAKINFDNDKYEFLSILEENHRSR